MIDPPHPQRRARMLETAQWYWGVIAAASIVVLVTWAATRHPKMRDGGDRDD